MRKGLCRDAMTWLLHSSAKVVSPNFFCGRNYISSPMTSTAMFHLIFIKKKLFVFELNAIAEVKIQIGLTKLTL
jgi:hypothetical protein